MDCPVQWNFEVEIFKVLLGLVQNDGWNETSPIFSGRDKSCAPEWWSLYSFHLPHSFTWEEVVSEDGLVPPSIGIKPNFVTVPYSSGSWLNSIEVIGDVHILQ